MWVEIGALGAGIVVLAVLYRKRLERTFGTHDAGDEQDVRGKIVLITGGNSGLGKECALEMAKRGAIVIIASRNMELNRKAIGEIRKITSLGELIPMQLDLGSLESVRDFVNKINEKYDKINILINNAGVFCPLKKRMKTADGFEYNMGVNHLGHFLLTNLLLEKVKNGAPSRIVVVASTLAEKGKLDFDDLMLEKEDPETSKFNAYGNSKLANILFAKELALKLVGTEVHTYALCPGWVKTDLARYMDLTWKSYLFMIPAVFLFMRTPQQGVQTILHCALSRKVATETGKLYRNCGPSSTKAQITDDMAKALWGVSEKLVGMKN